MANRRQVLQAITVGLATQTASHAQSVPARTARERIVGVYRLSKVVRRTADGQETVTNANPTGRISYDTAGRV